MRPDHRTFSDIIEAEARQPGVLSGWVVYNGICVSLLTAVCYHNEAAQNADPHRVRANSTILHDPGFSDEEENDAAWLEPYPVIEPDPPRPIAQLPPPLIDCIGPCAKIYSVEEVTRRFAEIQSITSDKDEREKISQRLGALKLRGGHRKLATIPPRWRKGLDSLEKSHENFTQVIDYLRGVFALAGLTDSVAKPCNLLIDGPPGCGKTFFTQRLAELMRTDFHEIHLETVQSSSDIVGDSDCYRNSKPGCIYRYLTQGSFANPIVLMDEICKIGGDSRFLPQNALFRLFERNTAKTFCDEAEPWLTLDASRIFFICSSNDVESISPAIRSRLKRFTVKMPADPTLIIKSIFAQIKAVDADALGRMRLSNEAVQVLMTQSP